MRFSCFGRKQAVEYLSRMSDDKGFNRAGVLVQHILTEVHSVADDLSDLFRQQMFFPRGTDRSAALQTPMVLTHVVPHSMFPLVHPGVAYLLYTAYIRLVHGKSPDGLATVALVSSTVIPDVVDLPLYYFGGAPSTRTVAHSILAGVGLSSLVVLTISRSSVNNRVGVAFVVGYLSHLLADAVWPLVLWLPEELRYLGWPLTQQPPYEGTKPLGTISGVTVTTLWVELTLLAVAIAVWWRDGRPGFRDLDKQ